MNNVSVVVTVNLGTSLKDVLQKMQSGFIKHIVVESEGKPVGIVTERDINRFLDHDKTARALEEISVEQVMIKDLVTIASDTSDLFNRVAESMNIFKIGSVILIDSDKRLTGIVTKTDITKVYGTVYGGKFKVKDYMIRKVFTCRKSDSLRFAINMINQNRISRLIVTDNDGKALGVISTNNFLTHSLYFTEDKIQNRDYLLPSESKDTTVGDLVDGELLAINLNDDLAVAAQKMVKNHINGIPVVDDFSNLVGVIGSLDVVRAFVKVPLTADLMEKYSKLY